MFVGASKIWEPKIHGSVENLGAHKMWENTEYEIAKNIGFTDTHRSVQNVGAPKLYTGALKLLERQKCRCKVKFERIIATSYRAAGAPNTREFRELTDAIKINSNFFSTHRKYKIETEF